MALDNNTMPKAMIDDRNWSKRWVFTTVRLWVSEKGVKLCVKSLKDDTAVLLERNQSSRLVPFGEATNHIGKQFIHSATETAHAFQHNLYLE